MMDMKDGGPAFPRPYVEGEQLIDAGHIGMSLRDWFAGQALAHFDMKTASKKSDYSDAPEWIARVAYKIADAMLEARKEGAQ